MAKAPSPIRERPLGSEEALAKTLLEFMNPKNIEFFSELDDEEILMISALKTWAKETKLKILNEFVTHFLKLRVSKHRQSRREIPLAIGLAGSGIPAGGGRSIRSLLSSLRI